MNIRRGVRSSAVALATLLVALLLTAPALAQQNGGSGLPEPSETPSPLPTEQPSPEPTPTPEPTETPGGPEETETPAPTETPRPTETPAPTETPGGPEETESPAPTERPRPTETPGGPSGGQEPDATEPATVVAPEEGGPGDEGDTRDVRQLADRQEAETDVVSTAGQQTLASTGLETAGLVVLAVALLGGGAALVWFGRQRTAEA